VVGGGIAIVSAEQHGVWIGRCIVPTLGGAPETIVSPVFDEDFFDPGEEAHLRILKTS
jgi:hypothetical protein